MGMKMMPTKTNAVITWNHWGDKESMFHINILEKEMAICKDKLSKIYFKHTHPGVKIGLQAGSSCCVNLESGIYRKRQVVHHDKLQWFIWNIQKTSGSSL